MSHSIFLKFRTIYNSSKYLRPVNTSGTIFQFSIYPRLAKCAHVSIVHFSSQGIENNKERTSATTARNSTNWHKWRSFWKGWIPISAGIGFTFLAVWQWKRWQSKCSEQDEQLRVANEFEIRCYRAVPLRMISRAWGWLSCRRVPLSMREWLYTKYSTMFGVNLEEVADDLISFDCLSDFFIRQLKQGVRPVAEAECLISPADGTVLNFGRITSCNVEQVKGVTYAIKTFLGEPSWRNALKTTVDDNHNENKELELSASSSESTNLSFSQIFAKINNCIVLISYILSSLLISSSTMDAEPSSKSLKQVCHDPSWEDYKSKLLEDSVNNELYQLVVYLAPGDYHRFHSPVNWKVTFRRHFQGELLSVNPVIAEWVPELFSLNERAVYVGRWQYGFFSMTAVGATNVGSIRVYSDETLHTNTKKWRDGKRFRDAVINSRWLKGEEVGEFRLGSTIVLLFEAPQGFEFSIEPGQKIRVGQSVCCDKEK